MLRTVVAVGVGLVMAAGGVLMAQQTQAQPGAQVGTQPGQVGNQNYLRGQIVKVDPATNKVWIRTGTGATAKEQAYLVGPKALYYGANGKALDQGLRAKDFRPGANIMYRMGPGNTGISELRFGQVTPVPPGTRPPAGAAGAGAGTGGGGR